MQHFIEVIGNVVDEHMIEMLCWVDLGEECGVHGQFPVSGHFGLKV
jgi:hypothetical protein